jgi:hypothetical protein
MKTRFWIGVAIVVLGLASLFVSVPHKEKRQVSAGGLSIGVELQRPEGVPRVVSFVLVVVGGALIITGVPQG